MRNIRLFNVGVFLGTLIFIFLISLSAARAAITQDAPPINGFVAPNNLVVGGGAIVPLVKFRLVQSSGADTLTKVGLQISASSTMTRGAVSRISLWKESGATPDFQIDQDTFIEGAASATPLVDGSLIILQPTSPLLVGAQSTEFFIVATTSGASINTGNAFEVILLANYASTSAGAVGTPFTSNRKINLNKTATLKISEVRTGSLGNTGDEFIELYNSGDAAIDLKDLPLALHIFDILGSSSPKTLTYYKTVIQPGGFFLITSQTNYSGGSPADAVYSTLSGNTLAPNTGFSIATTTLPIRATSTPIDAVGWGTEPSANCENSDTLGAACAPNLAEDGSSLERIALGYPDATSSAPSMAQGGADAGKGNGVDRNDNSAEFVPQTTPYIQNTYSPKEISFGGGPDTTAMQVSSSYPSNNMIQVPIDRQYIGFNFNKTVATNTLVSLSATTTVRLTTGGGSNLCTSVTYNPSPSSYEPQAKCVLSGQLAASSTYNFIVTSDVKDLTGNQLDQDTFQAGNQTYSISFTTGNSSQTFTNITPPFVIGASPFPGSLNVPTNLATIMVEFNTAMNSTTFNSTNITLSSSGGNVSLSNFSYSTTTNNNFMTFVPGALSASTQYTLTIGTGVKSANNIFLPSAYISKFTTGSQPDASVPQVVGVLPTPNSTITANTNDFFFTFDDSLDISTATSGAVTLAISGGANLPGTVEYEPVQKEGHFIPNNVLPVGQTLILTLKGGSLKNVAGLKLGADVTRTWTVEGVNSDFTGPSILFANADDFNIAITFNEAVNSNDVTNLVNYALTLGGTSQNLSALAGHKIVYDALARTATLSGIRLSASSTFVITAQNIKDISGNNMSGLSSFTGTVTSFSQSGGFIGPGSFEGSTFGANKDFSSFGIGFMPPVNIRPISTFINASTSYGFELPISKQIPANGTMVVTFPSSSDFRLCCAATSTTANPFVNDQNKDINGFGQNTVGIKTITVNTLAKTVTLTLSAATRLESGDAHDFLKFFITSIKNPSIPKNLDSSGYVFDIKSKDDSGNLLESFSANPVYITGGSAGGGATTTIRGTVSGNGGNLQSVTVHLMSSQTGPLDATTDVNGLYQFIDMPVNSQYLSNNFGGGGEYYLFTDPFVNPGATSTGFFGSSMPTPVSATSSSFITRNFSLTATSSAINFSVKLTASASTFTSSEELDVFAGGPGQFVVRTVVPGAGVLSAATVSSIPIPQTNGVWNIGVGPAMPKGVSGGFSGPPPSPTWSMPKPAEVIVSGCPTSCIATIGGSVATSYTFIISVADKTISGVLKDTNGNSIANAMVFAYSPQGGTGNTGQTSAAGIFSIKVVAGSYIVGAYVPGVGKSKETPVVVDSSGNVFVDGSSSASTGSSGSNPFTLKMVKPSYTISGQVTDGTNAVGNALVFAYRTDAPGRVDTMTDSSTGNYTLYVDNGTWKVSAFVPGFGPMSEQTVTVSGSSQSNINFAPSSSATYSILSGNLYEDTNSSNGFNSGEGISGAVIRVSGTAGTNEGVSGNDGAFSIRALSGSGYSITDIFHPTYGKIAASKDDGTAIGTINLTSSTTQNIRIPVRNTVTINIRDSNGNLLVVPKAFIDLFATSTKQATHIDLTNASSTSLQFATGTMPILRVYIQGVPPSNISIASDSANTVVISGGAFRIDHSTEVVKATVNTSAAAFSYVSGTVYKNSASSGNELTDAWIQFVDQTNGIFLGTQSTTSGAYSLKAANGTYSVLVSKPGFLGSPTTVTISGTTSQNFVLEAAGYTISGQVTAGGSAAANAYVRAEKIGGGQAVTKTDGSGNYSLSVTSGSWKVFASAEGYSSAAYASNPVTISSSASGVNVALTTTVSLQSKLATSNTFNDTSAGSFNDSTVGVSVDLDSNALGSSGNSSYITAKETSNIPDTVSVSIVGNKAKDISAFSGGSQVKNLQSGKEATIELTYTVTELNAAGITSTSGVATLTVVSYSDDKQEWESLSTVASYKDSSGNVVALPALDLSNVSSVTFSTVGAHFSEYALSSPTGVSPPDTPTSVSATAGALGSGKITVSWGASSGAEGYFIYRSTVSGGSFPLVASAGNVTSYTDSGLALGTRYYYKVSAVKSSGSSESAASGEVNAVATNFEGGGPIGLVGGGGGGGATPAPVPAPAAVPAPVPASAAVIPLLPAAVPTPVVVLKPAVFAITSDLLLGSRGSEVMELQKLLASDKGIYPDGLVTGYFGKLTELAVKRFQAKYGISQVGRVGPITRVKLAEISAKAEPRAPEVAKPSPVAAAVSPVFNRSLSAGARSEDVRRLQQLLASVPELYPEGIITGYFGSLTGRAVERFQEKYGIASIGDVGYGNFGPKTRAKLQEVFK